MSETSQSVTTILGIILILAIIGWVLWLVFGATPKEEVSAENVVEEFGLRLKQVSLLSDPEVLEQTMQSQYGELVAPELIDDWTKNPTNAPGRMISSPWPDRIEIVSLVRTSSSHYEVRGYVVEVANSDTGISEVARRPITLAVMLLEGKWVITNVELGPYQELNVSYFRLGLIG